MPLHEWVVVGQTAQPARQVPEGFGSDPWLLASGRGWHKSQFASNSKREFSQKEQNKLGTTLL